MSTPTLIERSELLSGSDFARAYHRYMLFRTASEDYQKELDAYNNKSALGRLFSSRPKVPPIMSENEHNNQLESERLLKDLQNCTTSSAVGMTFVTPDEKGKVYCKCNKDGSVELHSIFYNDGTYYHEGMKFSNTGRTPVKLPYPESEIAIEKRFNCPETRAMNNFYERACARISDFISHDPSLLNQYNNSVNRVLAAQAKAETDLLNEKVQSVCQVWKEIVESNRHTHNIDKLLFDKELGTQIAVFIASHCYDDKVVNGFFEVEKLYHYTNLVDSVRDSVSTLRKQQGINDHVLDTVYSRIDEKKISQDREQALSEKYVAISFNHQDDFKGVLDELVLEGVSLNATPIEIFRVLEPERIYDYNHNRKGNTPDVMNYLEESMTKAYEHRICSVFDKKNGFFPLDRTVHVIPEFSGCEKLLSCGAFVFGNTVRVYGIPSTDDNYAKKVMRCGTDLSCVPSLDGLREICESKQFKTLERLKKEREKFVINKIEKKPVRNGVRM